MKNLNKHIIQAFFIGTMVFIITVLLETVNGKTIAIDNQLMKAYGYNQLYSVVLYLMNYYVVFVMVKRFQRKVFKLKNLAIAILLSALATAIGVFFIQLIINMAFEGQSFMRFIENQNPFTYWLSITVSITITVVFYIVYYNQQKRDVEVKTQKIIAGTASARFDALKNQLDPHFLFNSLNVLSSLIDENPRNAQRFTTSLSKVYRYVLDQKNKDLVTVNEELDFARTYSSLLMMRFEESVIFDIPAESTNPEARVVPLSLQLLLENAVKHNVVSAKNPLRITIYEEAGFLVVKNNLQEKEVLKKREGVGLSNIKERYGLLTNRAMKVFKTQNTFEAHLPILTRQVSASSQHAFDTSETYTKSSKAEDTLRAKAKEKVKRQQEFYGNLTSYCIVIPFLAFVNYRTMGWGFMWFLFPLFGWGFGLVMHAIQAFEWNPLFGSNWEERKIKDLMNKDSRK